jgi:hypothetical protein
MISETGYIRVIFTVTCGSASSCDCPEDDQLKYFRLLSGEYEGQDLTPSQLTQKRGALVAELQSNHLTPDGGPSLIDIGHYRMPSKNNDSRDVFVGLAQVPDTIFARHVETMLLSLTPEAPEYLGEMFSAIFRDLQKAGPSEKGFCWLSWTVVPLVEALEGRFNPLGMSGIGKC